MSIQMKKMLMYVGIIFGIIFGWLGAQKVLVWIFMSHYEPPPVTVSATTAVAQVWQSYVSSVGTLTAVNGVDISAEVPGSVKEIHFVSGQFVNQGDLLVLLDTSVEQAELKSYQAKLKLAQINFERNETLLKKNAISQSIFDTSLAELKEAEANVEATQARIKQKTITAPFSGKIGIRQIDLGEYIAPGNAMVSLQSLDPLYVKFNLPEQNLPVLYLQQPVEININNLSGGKSIAGTITAINSKVDQTTRNMLIQATIPNKNLQLYPGMFASVKVWLQQKNKYVTLPQTSISYSLHGDSVFIIKNDSKKKKEPVLHAYRQYVEVGERRGDQVAILKGIQAGDQVVTSGQLKLQNGTHIVIDNSVEL